MSHKVYVQFQTTHLDPEVTTTLPSSVARSLAVRADYKNSIAKRLDDTEVQAYNAILADKGKEAADEWLTELWAS